MNPLILGAAAAAAAAVVGTIAYRRARKITIIPARSPDPAGIGASKILAPIRATKSVTFAAQSASKGQGSCVFGSDPELCDWSPISVQLLGKQKFRWGVCIADWKEYLEEKTNLGKKQFWVDRLNTLIEVANWAALGIPQWLMEHACGMTQWEMLAYEIDGSTYFGIKFIDPEPHILTGEPVKPPPLPSASANAWIRWNEPNNRMNSIGIGSGNEYEVATLFFPDGHIREIVTIPQLRTALRDGDIPPATLSNWTGSNQKWWATTRKDAMGKFR